MKKVASGGLLGVLFLFSCPLSLSAQVVIQQPPAYFSHRQRLPKTAIEAAVEMAYLGAQAGARTDALQYCMQGDRKGALDYVEQLRQGIKPVPADVSRETQQFQGCYKQQFDLFGLLPIKLEPPPGKEAGLTPP